MVTSKRSGASSLLKTFLTSCLEKLSVLRFFQYAAVHESRFFWGVYIAPGKVKLVMRSNVALILSLKKFQRILDLRNPNFALGIQTVRVQGKPKKQKPLVLPTASAPTRQLEAKTVKLSRVIEEPGDQIF